MTTARRIKMGNGDWWCWRCQECARLVGVEAKGGPETLGEAACPYCGAHSTVEVKRGERR